MMRPARMHIATIVDWLHRMLGVPDYDAYVAHVREHHPTQQPLPKDVFFRQRLQERYTTVGNRCC